jgi:hypothetical protein
VQVAMLWSNDLGIFSRLPTDNEIKAQTLVAFANRVLEGKARRDREAEAWLERLDFAESSKGKALLVAYVMVPEQARKMMFR